MADRSRGSGGVERLVGPRVNWLKTMPGGNLMHAVSFAEVLDSITDYWSPKVVGRVNDQYVKVAKLKDQLAWHKHDDEDELFHVIRGRLVIELEGGRKVAILPGEFFIVPRGVMHNPVAEE